MALGDTRDWDFESRVYVEGALRVRFLSELARLIVVEAVDTVLGEEYRKLA